jgi:hypothetical protein
MAGGGGARTTTTEPWESQVPFLQQGFQSAKNIGFDPQGNLTPPAYYGGKTLAGFRPAEQQAMMDVVGYTGGPRPARMQEAAESALTQGLGGANTVDYSAGPFGEMRGALERNVVSSLTRPDGVLSKIRTGLVGTSPHGGQHGGSSRGDMLQQQAITDAVTKGLSTPLAGLYYDAYSGAQERVPQYMSQYPTIMGAPLGISQAMGGVGQQRRAMDQEGINRNIARYQYEATAPQTALQNYMAMISGDYGSAVTQPGPSPMSQAGSIASVLGALAPLF